MSATVISVRAAGRSHDSQCCVVSESVSLTWPSQRLLTPHAAAVSFANYERYWVVVRENLRRYVSGERMLSVVDIARGY